MSQCGNCGKPFDVDDAREEYNAEFQGDPDYDEHAEGLCGPCALEEVGSNISAGRAIDMMNGEEAYDDAFVQRWL